MAGDPDKSALEQLAEILLSHGVEFIHQITIKQHVRRPKDQQSLLQLLAIKRLRGGGAA